MLKKWSVRLERGWGGGGGGGGDSQRGLINMAIFLLITPFFTIQSSGGSMCDGFGEKILRIFSPSCARRRRMSCSLLRQKKTDG